MKLNIILGVFVLSIFIAAQSGCGGGRQEFVHNPSDTALVWVSFISPNDWKNMGLRPNDFYTASVWRMIKDTATFDTADANTIKKLWKRDTFYVAEITFPVLDSAGKQRVDSLKNPMFNRTYHVIPKDNILEDYNKLPNKLPNKRP